MSRIWHDTTMEFSSTNLFFILLLFSSNLLTFFFSTAFYSPTCVLTSQLRTAPAPDDSSSPEELSDDDSSEPKTLDLPSEFIAFTSAKKLPLGFNRNFDSDEILPSVGSSCKLFPDDLRRYMSYKVNGSCPDDELVGQKLLLKGCEPLPRRRCRSAAPQHSVEPQSLPESLWSTPSDSSVVWTAYTCKNYSCLINRSRNQRAFDDCKDCFDLNGRERQRWTDHTVSSNLDFTIDQVLAAKPPGTVRIGLDIGGGVATFAVRMRERNITIITTSMNLNGPFNNFIASRGVVPLYVSISQRLPFFDNTLDIIHSMHVLSNWMPAELLQFMMFDIYRVLRPGGLFWLDHFFCVGDQLEKVYAPLIESVGYKKVRWEVGRKLDRGPELNEMYLSALRSIPQRKC